MYPPGTQKLRCRFHMEMNMNSNAIPETSTTMLREMAKDADSPRWLDFVARYRPMMEAYMRERFPELDADEAIQETFIGLFRAMPTFRYAPDETGSFHNYLTGVLRHKALDLLRSKSRYAGALRRSAESVVPPKPDGANEADERRWRETIYDAALVQFLADPNVNGRARQIFIRTALRGESPADVARSLAVTRDVVDQTKRRMIRRLREVVEALLSADGQISGPQANIHPKGPHQK